MVRRYMIRERSCNSVEEHKLVLLTQWERPANHQLVKLLNPEDYKIQSEIDNFRRCRT